ncbi:MAG: hypothetical protein RB296_06505 [Acidobacteriota bacterium]|jgi:uncharacterized protein (TIGR04141 family)|nr:hypothetical protein [Acidobacteriota bacterium]
MSRSRRFSIYLLKEGYMADNALKDDHQLIDAEECERLPENSTLFLLDKEPRTPWWKGYWGIQRELRQTLKGAIVFIWARYN